MTKIFIKTDNSYLSDKVSMRSNHLPDKEEVNVLDAYSSNGIIWRLVQDMNPATRFNIARLDKEASKQGFYIKTDNLRFLLSTDLNVYDVIDLDAYGVPYKQLEILFRKAENFDHVVKVFVTFNTVGMGQMPKGMLKYLGITEEMIANSPILCSKSPEEKIAGYLSVKGVRQLHRRKTYTGNNYHCYVCFDVGGEENESNLCT